MADFILIDLSGEVLAELANRKRAALEACGNQAVTHAVQNIESAGRVASSNLVQNVNELVQGDTCYVGTDVPYAIYNEMGTGIYVAGGRKSPWAYKDEKGNWHMTRGMQGIHFLKNAVANHIDEYRGIILKVLKGI